MSMSTPKTSNDPSVTVTLDELARAINNMGLAPTVSAELLYHAILQVQASPYTPQSQITPAQQPSEDLRFPPEPRVVITSPEQITRFQERRKLLEMAKASFPNGVPDRY